MGIRVYRDDNAQFEYDYVAVVDEEICHLCEILKVKIPSWKQAVIRMHQVIDCPWEGLLFNQAGSALYGWHFLLDSEQGDIDRVEDENGQEWTFEKEVK